MAISMAMVISLETSNILLGTHSLELAWLRLRMDKTTGGAILCQGTGGTLGDHIMAGRHKSVLLGVHGQAPGVCVMLAQELPKLSNTRSSSHGWEHDHF